MTSAAPEGSPQSVLATRRRWIEFTRNRWSHPGGRPLSVAIAATYTVHPLVPHLGAALLDHGFAPKIEVAPYNQLFALCADHEAVVGAGVEVLVVLPRIDELAAIPMRRYLAGHKDALIEAQDAIETLVAGLANLRHRYAGTLIAGTLPWPDLPEADGLALDGEAAGFVSALQSGFNVAIDKIPDLVRLDVDALQGHFGIRHVFDARTWYLYRQPYREAFFAELGSLAARIIAATRTASRKCLVLDCDNTLWGGILGEDGLEGIRIGDEFPGSAYSDLQRMALHWRQQGVFLAVASKNNPDEVMGVFRRHDGMILGVEHISVFAVNWRPKSYAISDISHSLNISMDSIVLLDDSSYEIAEVRERHPDVMCIQVPLAPEKIVETVVAARPFDRLQITADDRARADRMAIEIERERLRAELPEAGFIARLDLCVDTFPIDETAISRVTQLINKTNQFNINTPRMTAEEVRRLSVSERSLLRAAKVVDRFGEYGLTCVACASPAFGDTWTLDFFMMSCRVLGRGVETSFLADIAAEVLMRGGKRLSARFVSTPRNAVCADFLPRHGFVQLHGGDWLQDAEVLTADRPAGRSK